MLKPLNIFVFDSEDIHKLIANNFDENYADTVLDLIAELTEANDNTIVDFYLPNKEEQYYYNDWEIKFTDLIVANSELNYGDTAYIMF